MIFNETKLKGAFIIDLQKIEDDRGFFARSYCQKEFSKYSLKTNVAQCNVSFNRKKGTLRGMHYQLPPKSESKLVRCTKGKIYDVLVDLRSESSTYCQWFAVELSGDNRKALYIPERFAHGFQTLEDNSEIFYQMFEYYAPEYSTGFRWNDPVFSIQWPIKNPFISAKDLSYSPFEKEL